MSLLLREPSRACPGAPDLASFPLPALRHCSSLAASPILSRPAFWPKGRLKPHTSLAPISQMPDLLTLEQEQVSGDLWFEFPDHPDLLRGLGQVCFPL